MKFLLTQTFHDDKNGNVVRLFVVSKIQDKCRFQTVISPNETLGKNPLCKNTIIEIFVTIIYSNYMLFIYQNSTCCS